MNINSGDTRLVLLCPAWEKYGTAKKVKPGTVILLSRADDMVPFGDREELVRISGRSAKALIEVDADHRLADWSRWQTCWRRANEVRPQKKSRKWTRRSSANLKETSTKP